MRDSDVVYATAKLQSRFYHHETWCFSLYSIDILRFSPGALEQLSRIIMRVPRQDIVTIAGVIVVNPTIDDIVLIAYYKCPWNRYNRYMYVQYSVVHVSHGTPLVNTRLMVWNARYILQRHFLNLLIIQHICVDFVLFCICDGWLHLQREQYHQASPLGRSFACVFSWLWDPYALLPRS